MSSSGNSGKEIAVIAGAGPAGITVGFWREQTHLRRQSKIEFSD